MTVLTNPRYAAVTNTGTELLISHDEEIPQLRQPRVDETPALCYLGVDGYDVYNIARVAVPGSRIPIVTFRLRQVDRKVRYCQIVVNSKHKVTSFDGWDTRNDAIRIGMEESYATNRLAARGYQVYDIELQEVDGQDGTKTHQTVIRLKNAPINFL